MEYFYSIGEKQAKILHDKLLKLGLIEPDKNYTVDEYKVILKDPKIFSELPLSTQTDLLYNPMRRIPRKYIETIEHELIKILKPLNIKFDIAGSYIRGKDSSGDIDMVLLNDSEKNWDFIKDIVNKKSNKIEFLEPFAHGSDKIATLIKIENEYVKIDIFLCDAESYVFTLLFAIGSGRFNIRMRSVAKRKGYLLNNKGLYVVKNGEMTRLNITKEEDIFKELGMIYRKPAERIL